MAIQPLPEILINQIAAGEVISRPSAAVKELVENSLDAGASSIEVALKSGGAEEIFVADNGQGIPCEELALAVQRHATSKLSRLEELAHIRSFGFRGEALSSLASVSQLTLTSATSGSSEAFQLLCCDGTQKLLPASHPQGTTVRATDLFYHLPARRKFLKSPRTELQIVATFLKAMALVHPQVAFLLKHEGKKVLHLPALETQDPIQGRLVQIIGKEEDPDRSPLYFQATLETMQLRLWILPPRRSPLRFTIINHRLVRDAVLLPTLRAAYARREAFTSGLPEPLSYVLLLEVPPEQLDVNVHPSKEEVRFQQLQKIYLLFLKALQGEQPVLPFKPQEATVASLPSPEAPSPTFQKPQGEQQPNPLISPPSPIAALDFSAPPPLETLDWQERLNAFSTFEHKGAALPKLKSPQGDTKESTPEASINTPSFIATLPNDEEAKEADVGYSFGQFCGLIRGSYLLFYKASQLFLHRFSTLATLKGYHEWQAAPKRPWALAEPLLLTLPTSEPLRPQWHTLQPALEALGFRWKNFGEDLLLTDVPHGFEEIAKQPEGWKEWIPHFLAHPEQLDEAQPQCFLLGLFEWFRLIPPPQNEEVALKWLESWSTNVKLPKFFSPSPEATLELTPWLKAALGATDPNPPPSSTQNTAYDPAQTRL